MLQFRFVSVATKCCVPPAARCVIQCSTIGVRPALYLKLYYVIIGAWGGVMVKALRYYSHGPGIDSRWCHWIFQ
jgi:hypothetical protein